ncbi:MAG: hypothetical protein V2A58_00085 [Planctomycetota bacterium]
MERRLIGHVAALAVLGLLCAGAWSAEQIDNPMYQNWARFKPGTFIIQQTTTKTEEMNPETRMTYTLKEVTPERVVLEMVMAVVVEGNEMKMPPQTIVHPAKIDKPEPEGGEVVKPVLLGQGSEEIAVKGNKIKTTWVKSQIKQEGETSIVTIWTSEEIPGSMVKMVTETKGDEPATTTMALVDFKAERQ